MNKKILLTTACISIFLSFCSFSLFGQHVISFKTQRASQSEEIKYKEHFKAYTVATLETELTSDLLRSQDFFDVLHMEAGKENFSFNLKARDLRPAHYKLRVADDTGIHEMPRTPNTTYYGYTKAGHYDVRITADTDFFYGMVLTADDAFYIEPARNIAPTAPEGQFIMYWGSDNLKKFTNAACGVMDTHQHHDQPDQPGGEVVDDHQNRMMVCKELDIALANDFEMFQEKGSITAVQNHNMGVINNVLTNYDDDFSTDLEFDVVEIFVAATEGADPWTNSTNANQLLDDFTDWGPTGFSNTHDVASLWSNRDFMGDVIGLAWLDAVCENWRYNIVQDFTNNAGLLRCLQAHEMGHNFSANHDAAGSNTIMAPSVSNTNEWSTASINSINSFINSLDCLGPCGSSGPPVADFSADETDGCTPFVVHFFDESDNNPTSWSWSFPGGSPPSSTVQNPIVTYNTAGEYNVTLVATNSSGSDSHTEQDFITVNEDPIAEFDYTVDELVVDFDNLSENADSYSWDFGDGNNSAQVNPTHEYEEDGTYEVTLEATNECGTDIFVIEIEIITLPFADFSATPTQGCEPIEVEFINYSSDNADSYQWSFPGGSPPTSTAFEPVIVYEIPGTYNVTLTVSNDAGEDVLTRTNYITVLPQPNATFSADVDGLEVSFNSSGSIGNSYLWNFGDGNTSTQQNPTHEYDEAGAYTVTLTVTNECGSDVHTALVSVLGAPVANFTSNITEGCAPLVVQYINQSTGQITSYAWVFQGGSPATSSQPSPTVTYNTPGVYDVTLTVSNAVGSDVQFNDNYITVHAETVSDFDFEINGHTVEFTNLSSNSTGSVWNFGDGLISDDTHPTHTYNNDGVYTVTLISEGFCGNDTSTAQVTIQSPPTADFSFQQISSCVPATVQFTNESSQNITGLRWSFEGGSPLTSTQPNPLVTYNAAGTYDVELIVFAPAGNDTLTMNDIVVVGASPDANFLITTNGNTVELENLSTNADNYEWSFGDGQISFEENPSHTYDDFGTYTILLLASNECGDDTMSIEIILGTIPNASFTYSDHNGCAPFEVQFIDQSQNNPTSWQWTFEGGNPSNSTLQHPVVVYDTPGSFTVSLQVTNGQGSDVLVLEDLIQVANIPDASFDHTVTDNFVSLFYPGIDYDSLHWDFGDGRTDNSLNPTVEYSSNGQYVITLIVYNACGNDTAAVTVDITGVATDDPASNLHGWHLQPNPFGEWFSIVGQPLRDGEVTITLLDVHGKLISTEFWHHTSGTVRKEIQAGHLPSGLILIQILDGNERIVLKGVHQ